MTWTCEQIEARLSDYVDGLMTAAERADYESHAKSCAGCTTLIASVASLVTDLRGLQIIDAPPRLVYNILNVTLGPRKEQATGLRGAFQWLGGLFTLRFAYGAISLVATFLILLTASGVNPRKAKLADFSPVNLYHTADRQAHLVYARSTKFVSDLRVVYEIQSRLSKDNELPVEQEGTVPQTAPGKNPGTTESKPATPRQQNRANGLSRQIEVLADAMPVASGVWNCPLIGRRIR